MGCGNYIRAKEWREQLGPAVAGTKVHEQLKDLIRAHGGNAEVPLKSGKELDAEHANYIQEWKPIGDWKHDRSQWPDMRVAANPKWEGWREAVEKETGKEIIYGFYPSHTNSDEMVIFDPRTGVDPVTGDLQVVLEPVEWVVGRVSSD